MGIFSRFSDIINANINAILDKAEDPEKMVKLIIQEMEETLVEVRTNSARIIADQKELTRHKKSLRRQVQDWEQKAELAISKGREDLARSALAEKLRLLAKVESISTELVQIDTELVSLTEEISQLQEKLNEAKARRNSLVVRHKSVESKLNIRKNTNRDRIEDTLSKLEQYEKRLDDMEGQVESYTIGTQTLAEEIDQLNKDEEIDNELEAIKNRMNKTASTAEEKQKIDQA